MTDRTLTSTELEMMKVLWERGGATVSEVLESLPENRRLAYTSVSTILRILEQKEVVKSVKEGRKHIYVPLINKETYESLSVKNLVAKVFDGSASSLVRHLINENLKEDDLNILRKLLEEKGNKQ